MQPATRPGVRCISHYPKTIISSLIIPSSGHPNPRFFNSSDVWPFTILYSSLRHFFKQRLSTIWNGSYSKGTHSSVPRKHMTKEICSSMGFGDLEQKPFTGICRIWFTFKRHPFSSRHKFVTLLQRMHYIQTLAPFGCRCYRHKPTGNDFWSCLRDGGWRLNSTDYIKLTYPPNPFFCMGIANRWVL